MRSVEMLMVAQDTSDIRATEQALRNVRPNSHLTIAASALEASSILHRQGMYAKAARPDIILIDIDLRDGAVHLLEEVKSDRQLRRIPVMVLASESEPEAVRDAYDRYANCILVKPVDERDFEAMMRSVEQFWLNVVALPTE